jgi:sugar phosphate isomerase/epimerase
VAVCALGGTLGKNPLPARAATGKARGFQLKYLLSAAMYGTAPLAEVLAQVHETGADAIDIWPMPHGNHREQMDQLGFADVDKLLAQAKVRLASVTRYDLGPYRLKEEQPLLERFGSRLIICGATPQKGDSQKERVKNFVESMKPHVTWAETNGITIGIENHRSTILDTPSAVRYFGELATSPNLGIAMAPYHLPQDPQVIASLIKDLGDKIVCFQAWQHGKGCMKTMPKAEELMQMPGRGPLDFLPILAALKEINYQGYTEIFMHPTPRGIPILESTAAVTAEINRARTYLESCVSRL